MDKESQFNRKIGFQSKKPTGQQQYHSLHPPQEKTVGTTWVCLDKIMEKLKLGRFLRARWSNLNSKQNQPGSAQGPERPNSEHLQVRDTTATLSPFFNIQLPPMWPSPPTI